MLGIEEQNYNSVFGRPTFRTGSKFRDKGPFTIKMLEFHLVTSCAFEISLLRFVNNFLTEFKETSSFKSEVVRKTNFNI